MNIAARHMRTPQMVRVDNDLDVPSEIKHTVYTIQAEARMKALCTLLDKRGDGPVLVFGRTKHGVRKLANKLADLGYSVTALQGNLRQSARERVMAEFRSGKVSILVATNVAARGLDVSGIEQVINYELPESAQLFTHRVGRTGRMGREGEAITFVTPEEHSKWRQMEKELGIRLPLRTWPNGQVVQTASVKSPQPERVQAQGRLAKRASSDRTTHNGRTSNGSASAARSTSRAPQRNFRRWRTRSGR